MLAPNETTAGKTGAARQSWRAASPRDLLANLIAKHPGADEAELLSIFEAEARKKDAFISTIIEYWFTNNYRSLVRGGGLPDPVTVAMRQEREAKQAEQREATLAKMRDTVKVAVKREARVMLLDLMMPNGKRLRSCTGKECLQLSKTTGRWLAALSRELKPAQKVGEALSEDRLHQLYEAGAS